MDTLIEKMDFQLVDEPLLNTSVGMLNTLERRIHESHRRSAEAGVRRDAEQIVDILDVNKLNKLLEMNSGLITHAKLLFNQVFQSLCSKQVLFVLTDARARILALHSHLSNLNTAAYQGVCLGASLSENSIGTNAVSLALHDLESAIIRGPQHYSRLFQGIYCVAVPFQGANGSLIGGVNISTIDTDSMDVKLALASFIAKDLEGYCVRNALNDVVVTPAPAIGLLSEGAELRLTERQLEVLEYYSQGLGYKQIARQLHLLSAQTVQEHLDVVRTKLGATSRRNCIRIAIEKNLLRK